MKNTRVAIYAVIARFAIVTTLDFLAQDPEPGLAYQPDHSAVQDLRARLLCIFAGPLQKPLGTMA